jgi:aspartyl protease family protein
MRYFILFSMSLFLLVTVAGKLATVFGITAKPAGEQVAAAATPAPPPAKSARKGGDVMYVARGRDGHFGIDAVIGGHRVPFLVDTGASIVALTSQTAARLHITSAMKGRRLRMQTANGAVMAETVRLASIQVGSLEVQDVEAVIMPPGRLSVNLLGMSFLSRLSRYEFRSGSLVLEQ